MFYEAIVFNADLSEWDTAKVEAVAEMFKNARLFNQDLSTWNTTNMVDFISSEEPCWWSRYNCAEFALNSGCPSPTCGVVFDENCVSGPSPSPPGCA